MRRFIKLPPLPLVLVILSFLLVRSFYLDFTYLWDGGVYFNEILKLIHKPFNLLDFNIFGHPSFAYVLFISLSQYFTPGETFLLNLQLLFLDILAILAFYKILVALFPDKFYRSEIYLLTVAFCFSPVLVANSINLNLDHGVFVFSVITTYALIYKKLILATFTGFFLVFSKESGIPLYLSMVLSYTFFLNKNYSGFSGYLTLLKKLWYLFIPLLSFLIYLMIKNLVFKESGLWLSLHLNSSNLSISSQNYKVLLTYLIDVFLLNFNWILSFFILLFIGKACFYFKKEALILKYSSILFVFFIFLGSLLPTLLFSTFTNSRYFMQVQPFLILLFYISLVHIFHKSRERILLLSLISILFITSCFFTIDPVSKKFFGTFKFGQHDILNRTSITKECCGYGRDQLVYNLQYTNFHYLQTKIFADIKPTSNTNISYNGLGFLYFTLPLDTKTYKRTFKSSDILSPNYIYLDELIKSNLQPDELYYVVLPNFENQSNIDYLKNQYQISDYKIFTHMGYILPIYRFAKLKLI